MGQVLLHFKVGSCLGPSMHMLTVSAGSMIGDVVRLHAESVNNRPPGDPVSFLQAAGGGRGTGSNQEVHCFIIERPGLSIAASDWEEVQSRNRHMQQLLWHHVIC